MSKLWFERNKILMSGWALEYCINVNDDQKMREFITDPMDALVYKTTVKKDIKWINELANRMKKDEIYNEDLQTNLDISFTSNSNGSCNNS